MAEKKERRAVVVYQGGIANVFEVTCFNMSDYGRNAVRLLQQAFGPCEWFAFGLAKAGWLVASAYCNEAGDIINMRWSTELDEAPFHEKFHPVWNRVDFKQTV